MRFEILTAAYETDGGLDVLEGRRAGGSSTCLHGMMASQMLIRGECIGLESGGEETCTYMMTSRILAYVCTVAQTEANQLCMFVINKKISILESNFEFVFRKNMRHNAFCTYRKLRPLSHIPELQNVAGCNLTSAK